MSKEEGNAHGRHYTEGERKDDAQRNHNRDKGRQHFEADIDQKAGGHSDRHANDSSGQQHEFRQDNNDDDLNRHSKPQDAGGMQGDARNQGGHQGGRNQPSS